jgi:hypothetical protein
MAVGSQFGICSESGDSQRGRETVNKEVGGYTVFEAVTRQPVNTQQNEKIYYVL